MKYEINESDVLELLGQFEEINKLMDQRIVDLHKVPGASQARHAYIYYRSLLWESKDKFTNSIKLVKPETT